MRPWKVLIREAFRGRRSILYSSPCSLASLPEGSWHRSACGERYRQSPTHTTGDCFIVGSVHDELIIECPPEADLRTVCDMMGRTPPWIPGLLLRADGYECAFYEKQ